MDVKQTIAFCTSVSVFFSFGVVLNGEVIQESSCSVNVSDGLIVAMKESKMEANASVFASLNVTTNSQCRQRCCMENKCSIYMFLAESSYSEKLHSNCFLVYCNPVDKCKYRPLSGCEIGLKMSKLITTTTPIYQTSTSPTEGGIPEGEDRHKTPVTTGVPYSQQASKPSIVLTIAPQELNNSIPENQNAPAQPEVNTKTVSQEYTESQSVIPSISSAQSSVLSSQTKTQGVVSPSTKPSDSTTESLPFVGAHKIPDFDSKHSHTNTASLVIALIFGIVFFTASTVLLGRRWWESFRRRRAFSKVDYLLNGL